MKYMELIAPCHFGMEAVLKREILDLGYEINPKPAARKKPVWDSEQGIQLERVG